MQDHASRSMWYIKADQKEEERSIVHSWIHELRDFFFTSSDLLYPPHLDHVLSLYTVGCSIQLIHSRTILSNASWRYTFLVTEVILHLVQQGTWTITNEDHFCTEAEIRSGLWFYFKTHDLPNLSFFMRNIDTVLYMTPRIVVSQVTNIQWIMSINARDGEKYCFVKLWFRCFL